MLGFALLHPNLRATNLAIDDDLINEALTVGHFKSKEDTVITALKELYGGNIIPKLGNIHLLRYINH